MDPAPPSKAKVFLRRLISSVVLWTIVIMGLFSSNRLLSNYLFLLIIAVLAVTGLAEFYGLAQKRDLVCFKGWGIVGGLLLMIGTFLNLTGRLGTSGPPARLTDFEPSFFILFVLVCCWRRLFSAGITRAFFAFAQPS